MRIITITKLFKSYILFKLKKTPLLAGYKITYNCNLQCKHCPFWTQKNFHLNFEQVKDVLKKISSLGARIIIFEGGEPTLWKDGNFNFNDILLFAKKLFLSVNFTTNGLNGFNWSADTIWVSIDGLEKTHDIIRGKGSFNKVITNIKSFKKNLFIENKPKIFANICINSFNYQEIPALICKLKNLIDGITIQFYYPFDNNFDLFLPIEKRIWVLNRLIELKREGFPLIDSLNCLESLKRNRWICRPDALLNAEPNGEINLGCYVKNRGEINCNYCGFAAHVELSNALNLHIPSIITGFKTFF